MKRVAIIGAGLGGLSAAIALARRGMEVDVYEKNNYPGGKAGELRMEGFRFDTGPSLVTMPEVIEEIFRDSGADLSDYLQVQPLDELCRYRYPDGTLLYAMKDRHAFGKEMEEKGTGTFDELDRFLSYSEKIYDTASPLFMFRSFHEFQTMKSGKALKTLFGLRHIDPMRTMHQANSSFFSDPRMVQLFDRYATYNGSDPYQVPATLNIIAHVENTIGGHIFPDGIHALPRALEKRAKELGVTFHYETTVTKIVTDRKNRVTGIRTENEELSFPVVLSNADVYHTYLDLLDDETSRDSKRYQKMEASSSAMIFYWGVEGSHDALTIHNILFSEDYAREFRQLFKESMVPDDPTVYIYISSKFRKEDAPQGHENWFVMINTPNNRDQDWKTLAKTSRETIIRKIQSMTGITPRILTERIATPEDIEAQTGSHRGSIYGISSNTQTAAFLRQRNRSTRYRGLYFSGGSAHPGGGIPLALLSGKISAELVERFEL